MGWHKHGQGQHWPARESSWWCLYCNTPCHMPAFSAGLRYRYPVDIVRRRLAIAIASWLPTHTHMLVSPRKALGQLPLRPLHAMGTLNAAFRHQKAVPDTIAQTEAVRQTRSKTVKPTSSSLDAFDQVRSLLPAGRSDKLLAGHLLRQLNLPFSLRRSQSSVVSNGKPIPTVQLLQTCPPGQNPNAKLACKSFPSPSLNTWLGLSLQAQQRRHSGPRRRSRQLFSALPGLTRVCGTALRA